MTISMPVGPMADGVAEEYDWDAESGFSMGGDLPEWRLVVAPARGIFHAPLVTTEPTAVTNEPVPVTNEPVPVTNEPVPVTSQDAGGSRAGAC